MRRRSKLYKKTIPCPKITKELIEIEAAICSSHHDEKLFDESRAVAKIKDDPAGAYAGFLRGGGPNFKISGILDIHMPRSCMSRAAKLRAFARGVWGHAPQETFLKLCNFVGFEGYFQPLSW